MLPIIILIIISKMINHRHFRNHNVQIVPNEHIVMQRNKNVEFLRHTRKVVVGRPTRLEIHVISVDFITKLLLRYVHVCM